MIVDCLIPAIQEKWPVGEWSNPNFKIKIQQDGAGGHCRSDTDPFIKEAFRTLEENGNFTPGKISFYTQPPQSPDLNILDLGLFNALQAQYYNEAPKDSIEIITMVQKTYDEYPANKINRLWVTLQSIYNCIIENHGDNNYKIPHMNKERLERLGELPTALKVSREALAELEGAFTAT